MPNFDQEAYLDMLHLEEKYTKRPSVWEVSKAFPDCRAIALRVAYDLQNELKEYDAEISVEPLVACFKECDPRSARLEFLKKYLNTTRPMISKKELDIEGAKFVPIRSLYDFEKMQPYGKRIKCSCPFHTDLSPSMVIYTDQNSFHCYSCSAGGSSIDFIMKLYDIPFVQAVNRLNNC